MGGRVLVMLLVFTAAGRAQRLPPAPVSVSAGMLSKQTYTAFAVIGTEVVADSVTTRVLYQRHYDETDPLAKPFVHAGIPGQIGGSLLGLGATAGMWVVLHRWHHDPAARWFLRSVAVGEGSNDARQFAILRTSQKWTSKK
jgi:hypothetical protein